MTTPERRPLNVTIVAIDPPFAVTDGVLFGVQSRHHVDDPRPACVTTEFHTAIDVAPTVNSGVDFAGEHVHGRRGDRFIYLAWGMPDPTEPLVMFARAKIKLDSIPADLLDVSVMNGQPLIAELQATNPKGQAASGTIKPPTVDWHTPQANTHSISAALIRPADRSGTARLRWSTCAETRDLLSGADTARPRLLLRAGSRSGRDVVGD